MLVFALLVAANLAIASTFAMIALAVDSYRHPNKAYGKIFTPKFDVVAWVDKGTVEEAVSAEAESAGDEPELAPFPGDDPAPAKGKGGRSKAATAPDTEF